jgi:molecular chaperone GrpE
MNKWINKIKNALQMNNNENNPNNTKEVTDQTTETTEATSQETTEATETTEIPAPAISEVDQLKIDVAQANDRYARLFSEFDNYKRRNARERIDLITTAAKDTIVELLPVLDDFERSLQATEKTTDIAALHEGVNLVYQKFKNLLYAKGLEPIDALNQPFDVALHEAITQMPAPTDDKKNTVFAEVEKGYKLNDAVVRYAKVVVAV